MTWAQRSQPSEANRTRADLVRELDAALHAEPTVRFPALPSEWDRLIEEVRALARCRFCPAWDGAECRGCHLTAAAQPVGEENPDG